MLVRRKNLIITYTPETPSDPPQENEIGDPVMELGDPIEVSFSIELDGDFIASEGVDTPQAKCKGRMTWARALPIGFPLGQYLPAQLITSWGETVACLAQTERLINESVFGFEKRFGSYFEINLRIP